MGPVAIHAPWLPEYTKLCVLHREGVVPTASMPRTFLGGATVAPPRVVWQKINVIACPGAPAASVKLDTLSLSVRMFDCAAAENVGVAEYATTFSPFLILVAVTAPIWLDVPITSIHQTGWY